MSNSAIRFSARTRGQSGIRTGMLAYQGIMAQVQKERYEAEREHAEHQSYLDTLPPLMLANAATYDYQTGQYRRHYEMEHGVRIVRNVRGHMVLKARY